MQTKTRTEAERLRELEFMTAVRGVPGHHVAKAYSTLSPAINWTGTSKADMAYAWASEIETLRRQENYKSVNLASLVLRAKARSNGVEDWNRINSLSSSAASAVACGGLK